MLAITQMSLLGRVSAKFEALLPEKIWFGYGAMDGSLFKMQRTQVQSRWHFYFSQEHTSWEEVKPEMIDGACLQFLIEWKIEIPNPIIQGRELETLARS